jgi:tetratricopeptide (TPR) repeat protein
MSLHARGRRSVNIGIVVLAIAIAYAGLGYPGLDTPGPDPRLAAIVTDLELAGTEPRVETKLRALIARALDAPESPEAWGALGMNLDVHGFDSEAVQVYRGTIELAPDEFRWPYYLAIHLHEGGYPEALRWFERGRELRRDYVPLLIRHGQALLDIGELDGADSTFTVLLEADSSLAVAYLMLGRSFLARDDLEGARDWLLGGLKVDPQDGAIHAMLVEVYRQLGEARDSELSRIRARLYSQPSGIDDPLYSELMLETVSSRGFLMRGQAYLKSGQPGLALREFDAALEARPSDPFVLDKRGQALQGLKRFEEAVEHHRAAVGLLPTSLVPRLNLASAHLWQREVAEAVAHADTARQLHPTSAQAHLSLGMYTMVAGDRSAAIDIFRRGLDDADFDTRIATRLAWLLATSVPDELRNGEEALQLAMAVCEIDGYGVPETLDVLAAAYAEVGRFGEAVTIASEARRLAWVDRKSNLVRTIERRLGLYAAGRPHRE